MSQTSLFRAKEGLLPKCDNVKKKIGVNLKAITTLKILIVPYGR